MNLKKSQLKEIIKQVVRESLQKREYARLIKEVSPPGAKAERMIQHVKKSLRDTHPEWDDDKIASVAIATAWKAHNKGSVEEGGDQVPKGQLAKLNPGIVKKPSGQKMGAPSGKLPPPVKKANEAGLTSEIGAESKLTPLDDIVKIVAKKTQNPEHVKYLTAQLFLHQYGKPADMDAVGNAVQRELGNQPSATGDLNVGPLEDNANPTDMPIDEPAPEPMFGGGEESEEHNYDEREEVKLIDQIKQTATKLMDMHRGVAPVPAPAPEKEEGPKKESGEKEEKPEKEEPKEKESDEKEKDDVDEAAYKQVSPNETDTAKEDKARTIQTDPKVNEASYKVASPTQARVAKCDHARKVQTEPKVTENHKVQARSAKTAKDLDNDPNNVRDPEVPQA